MTTVDDMPGVIARQPLITVAILTYNNAGNVGATIESALTQSYESIELLLQDDCSSDETVQILESYASKDVRIRVRVNERNLGAWSNYEAAIQNACGEFTIWLCPGDLLLPDYVGRCVDVLKRHPDTLAITSSQQVVDEITRQPIYIQSFSGPLAPEKLGRFSLASNILRKNRPDEVGRPHYGLHIHGLLKTAAMREVMRSFRGAGAIMNERMVLSQLALAGPFRSLEEVLAIQEKNIIPTAIRSAHDPAIKSNLKPFFFSRWTAMMTWSMLRSRIVPIRYKTMLPILIVPYLARNLSHIVLIRTVPVIQRLLPASLYGGLRSLWRRTRRSSLSH